MQYVEQVQIIRNKILIDKNFISEVKHTIGLGGLIPPKVCAINGITVLCYLFNGRLNQSYHKRSTIQRRKTSTN